MIPFVWKPQDRRDSAVDRGYHITRTFFLRMAGLYPDLQKGYKYILFGVYVNFVHVAYAYYVVAYIVATVYGIKFRDVELVGETLCYGSYTYSYCMVSWIFYLQRSNIDKILRMAGNGLFHYQLPSTAAEVKIQNVEMMKAKAYGRYGFIFPVVLGIVQMGVIPGYRGFVQGKYTTITNVSAPLNKNAPLPVWSPLEAYDELTFVVVYVCQMGSGMVEFFIFHATCTFFVGNCCVLLSNLKLLHHSLDTIFDRAVRLHVLRGGKIDEKRELFGDGKFQACMRDSLKENIKHHMTIIKYHKLCQIVFNWILFFIMVGAAVNVSTPPYTIVKVYALGKPERTYATAVVMGGLLIMGLVLLSRYCYYGQDVITQSEMISHSYYNTPWPDCDARYGKLLVIAMSNSLGTLSLKAAIIGTTMSAATLLHTIQNGYSLFNLLVTTQ